MSNYKQLILGLALASTFASTLDAQTTLLTETFNSGVELSVDGGLTFTTVYSENIGDFANEWKLGDPVVNAVPPLTSPHWPHLPSAHVSAGCHKENFDSLSGVIPSHMAVNMLDTTTRFDHPDAWCNVGQPNSLPGFSGSSGTGQTHEAAVTEDFEAYSVGFGLYDHLHTLTLDDTTTIPSTGQGPGLVLDGVTYSCAMSTLQWNGAGYFGIPSQTILANTSFDGVLRMDYDHAQATVSFDMHALSGFPDTATVYVYDTVGSLIHTSSPLSIPDANPVNFSYAGSNIGAVAIDGSAYSWSPAIDNHVFCSGFCLSATGAPGGFMTFDVTGAIPGGFVFFGYAFGLGNHSVYNPITADLVTTGLSSNGFTFANYAIADGTGNASVGTTVPFSAIGKVHVQAIDSFTNGTSNVVSL